MKTKSLANIDETEAVTGFEQIFSFKIGEEGYTYESCLERDCEGNIESIEEPFEVAISSYTDAETCIAGLFLKDSEVWYDLDQQLFDAEVGETFTYYMDVDAFMKKYYFDEEKREEKREFLKKHEEKGYMKVYITVTENTILEEE